MTKKLFLFLSTFSVLFMTRANAQVSGYSFTQGPGIYGAASNGSLIGTTQQDDDVNTVALPFTFTFNGTPFMSVAVCSNGYLSFGSLTGSEYTAISDGSTQQVIAPFADDLFMGTVISGDFTAGSNTITNLSSINGLSVGDSLLDIFFDFGGINPVITGISGNNIILNIPALNNDMNAIIFFMNGSIKQSVSGIAPSRVCEFEFKNMTRIFVFDEVINFKVRLYESSNKIEFVYGGIIPGTDQTAPEVGLKGTSSNDFNSRNVNPTATWSNSAPSVLITDACDFSDVNYPASGLKYVWTTTDCAIPAVVINSSGNNICAGETATLIASGAPSYTWSSGATGSVITVSPNSNQSYTVVGAIDNCSASVAVNLIVGVCTGLHERFNDGKNFVVYPNPSKGSITIKTEAEGTNSVLNIYNVLGSLVYSSPFGNDKELSVNTGLQEGIYILELRSENNNKQVKQIIIEK